MIPRPSKRWPRRSSKPKTIEKRPGHWSQVAQSVTDDAAAVAGKSRLAVTRARLLQAHEAQLDVYRDRITAIFDRHPDHALFRSLPGAGERIAPAVAPSGGRREHDQAGVHDDRLAGKETPASREDPFATKRPQGSAPFRGSRRKLIKKLPRGRAGESGGRRHQRRRISSEIQRGGEVVRPRVQDAVLGRRTVAIEQDALESATLVEIADVELELHLHLVAEQLRDLGRVGRPQVEMDLTRRIDGPVEVRQDDLHHPG